MRKEFAQESTFIRIGKRPANTLKYGTAVIKVNNRVQFHKVKGMIEGIVMKSIGA